MSVGINLMYELIQRAASVLGDRFDIEIVEKHHNQKIDALVPPMPWQMP